MPVDIVATELRLNTSTEMQNLTEGYELKIQCVFTSEYTSILFKKNSFTTISSWYNEDIGKSIILNKKYNSNKLAGIKERTKFKTC